MKSAAGATDRCISHGGGKRCELECCASVHSQVPTISSGRHPEDGRYMCRFAIRVYIQQHPNNANELMKHFGLKKHLVMRGEHAFYHELCKLVPELRLCERVLDQGISSQTIGKRKRMDEPRPDYFHYFGDALTSLGLHGEYDESKDHEDNDDRLEAVSASANCKSYVFRVCGWHGTDRAVCRRRVRGDYAYYQITDEGKRVVQETADIVRERLTWIGKGLPPNKDRSAKVYVNFK